VVPIVVGDEDDEDDEDDKEGSNEDDDNPGIGLLSRSCSCS
jgi:hypothetical protein